MSANLSGFSRHGSSKVKPSKNQLRPGLAILAELAELRETVSRLEREVAHLRTLIEPSKRKIGFC